MLDAREASFAHQGHTLLQPVSFAAGSGELTIIVGPNGAGKSTLLSLLSGFLPASSGSIRINGCDPQRTPAKRLAAMRAVVEQQARWQPGMLASELVQMGGYLAHDHHADWRRAMQMTECTHLAARPVESLSGGERQRLQLARALLQLQCSQEEHRFLLLDEPTAALDFGMADALMARIHGWTRTLNLGVVAVVHDLNLTLRHADRVLLLSEGRMAACGPCAEVMQRPSLEAIYGVRLAELASDDLQHRAFIPLQ